MRGTKSGSGREKKKKTGCEMSWKKRGFLIPERGGGGKGEGKELRKNASAA